jgi:hypothetical protein
MSRAGEVLFEIIHPDNSWTLNYIVLDRTTHEEHITHLERLRLSPTDSEEWDEVQRLVKVKPFPASLMQFRGFGDSKSRRTARFGNSATYEGLVDVMKREVNSEYVCPVIRYVREIKSRRIPNRKGLISAMVAEDISGYLTEKDIRASAMTDKEKLD